MPTKEQIKDPEKLANVRRHQFGQPGANPRGDQKVAVSVRDFMRRLVTMTESEMVTYANDVNNPFILRRVAETMCRKQKPKDLFSFVNQIEGMPVQPISTEEMPDIIIDLSGNGENKG